MDKKINKTILLLLAVLVLATIGADSVPTPLMRLVVVNKSGLPIEIRLTGQELGNIYYLRLAKGSRAAPVEQTFTVAADAYAATIYFIEPWDPVYGTTCSATATVLDVNANVRATVLECTHVTPRRGWGRGEPPRIVKVP
jgi:hypothetical protein